jgi:hypothetical protein
MTQKFDHINASEPVSTVTKHIKIYSDNPIHDCIDRIINSCVGLDEGGDYTLSNAIELQSASQDLLVLTCHRLAAEHQKIYPNHDAKKRN